MQWNWSPIILTIRLINAFDVLRLNKLEFNFHVENMQSFNKWVFNPNWVNKTGKRKWLQASAYLRTNRNPYHVKTDQVKTTPLNSQNRKIEINLSYLCAREIQPGIPRCSIHLQKSWIHQAEWEKRESSWIPPHSHGCTRGQRRFKERGRRYSSHSSNIGSISNQVFI
jgi:hypothetical protein